MADISNTTYIPVFPYIPFTQKIGSLKSADTIDFEEGSTTTAAATTDNTSAIKNVHVYKIDNAGLGQINWGTTVSFAILMLTLLLVTVIFLLKCYLNCMERKELERDENRNIRFNQESNENLAFQNECYEKSNSIFKQVAINYTLDDLPRNQGILNDERMI